MPAAPRLSHAARMNQTMNQTMTRLATPTAGRSSTGQTFNIRLPQPHVGQIAVREAAARWNWLVAHRRWRKSTLAVAIIIEAALSGGEYGWFAPTFRQVRVGWDEMRRALGASGAAEFNEGRLDIRLAGGGRVRCASLDDPDNVRGWTLDGFAMDEASECPERAFYEVLRPMLMDTNGWAWLLFTPKGRNWSWREFMSVRHGDASDDARAWQIPANCQIVDGALVPAHHPLGNPDIPFSELEDMFASMPERAFRQEILAEFLDDAGGVFRGVEAAVRGELLDAPPSRVTEYVIGVDLAKHKDYTVLCIGDLRARQLVAFDRYNRADWGLQKARIIETARRWNNAWVWMDATGVGDPIYDDLRRAGLRIHPYRFTPAAKEALINHAVLLVEQHGVGYPPVPVLLHELKALQYSRTAGGVLRMAAPEGLHDDAAMAFALMCWPMGHSGGSGLSEASIDLLSAQGPRMDAASEFGGIEIMRRSF